MNAGRVMLALVGLITATTAAHAVPVTWEARGVVEFSDLDSAFFATYMPALAGTQTGDGLVLRISFDTDAGLLGQTSFPSGGTGYAFDPASLVLQVEVPGRGTHVFGIDATIPPDTVPSAIGIIDDFVTGIAEQPVIDGLQFRHGYFTAAGDLEFSIAAGFFSTDTSVVSVGLLPLAPDPRLAAGVERQISIVDPGGEGISRSLFGTFSSLVRLPRELPEPGSLALLLLGLAALAMSLTTGRGTTTARCR